MGTKASPRARRSGRTPVYSGNRERLIVVTERRAWFTPDLLASYLQVSDRMVRKWVKQGRLRSYKIDGCRRFDPADVDDFVAQFLDDGTDHR